ncbi:universal stress protein [Candidatus Obscuribacterales bacterium]|nr:universal stress protein [Candidatus Obscuribacterales bacterium]
MKVLVAIQDEKCVDELGAYMRKYPWPTPVEFRVLHVIHPVRVNSYMSLLPAPLTDNIAAQRKKAGEAVAKQLAEQLRESFPGIPVDEQIVEGEAKSEIVDQLTDWNADLVLLGSHGKHGLMGSVSRTVVAHSPCSAIVVPVQAHDRKSSKEKIHIII